ncbi:GntR family transcriptional regulator [Mangrovibacillus cuniculi]|uniref:GntR family transcriptional regulator n=1 Tax=Mangrovibacillus cuniculi TaxID=2593652 RepID=A0A7S8C8V9_9BACI|nr:GntR family transcriptional regulator [Mangrovibacillus cuniculi]QPC45549.1 GntR family transcriptional regulator [Mangrovibacillus cuniculi]
MFIQLDPASDVPIYEQLRNSIMEGIVRGDLKPGDVLPSVRSLAGDLSVNMHTVNKSYHELEKKGIIRIVPKSGAVVEEFSKEDMTEDFLHQLSEALRPTLVESLIIGLSEEEIQQLIKKIIEDVKGD